MREQTTDRARYRVVTETNAQLYHWATAINSSHDRNVDPKIQCNWPFTIVWQWPYDDMYDYTRQKVTCITVASIFTPQRCCPVCVPYGHRNLNIDGMSSFWPYSLPWFPISFPICWLLLTRCCPYGTHRTVLILAVVLSIPHSLEIAHSLKFMTLCMQRWRAEKARTITILPIMEKSVPECSASLIMKFEVSSYTYSAS